MHTIQFVLQTWWGDKIGEVEIQFFHSHLDVVRLHAEAGVAAVWGLPKALSIRGLQGEGVKEDSHDEVQPPDLVCLTQTVNAAHLSLLVWSREAAAGAHLPCDGLDEVFAVFRSNILSQLC